MILLHKKLSFKPGNDSNGWTIDDIRKAPYIDRILLDICQDLAIKPADVPDYSFNRCKEKLQKVIDKCSDKNGYSVAILLKPETRGGARDGAGRKPNTDKKIRISTSLAPDVIQILASKNTPIAQYIEMAVRDLNLQEISRNKKNRE